MKFLWFGWWLMHIVSVALVFAIGYRKGRDDERAAAGVDGRQG